MTQTTQEQLVEAIENADSKDALESLGKRHLGVDVDKRRGLENIRMDLLEKVEDDTSESSSTETAQTTPAPKPEQAKPAAEIDAGKELASVVTVPVVNDPDDHVSEEDDYDDTPTETTRKLVNTKTGRRFAWTAALARLSHMKEV